MLLMFKQQDTQAKTTVTSVLAAETCVHRHDSFYDGDCDEGGGGDGDGGGVEGAPQPSGDIRERMFI